MTHMALADELRDRTDSAREKEQKKMRIAQEERTSGAWVQKQAKALYAELIKRSRCAAALQRSFAYVDDFGMESHLEPKTVWKKDEKGKYFSEYKPKMTHSYNFTYEEAAQAADILTNMLEKDGFEKIEVQIKHGERGILEALSPDRKKYKNYYLFVRVIW